MSDLLTGILPLIFIFGTALAVLIVRDLENRKFEAFGEEMTNFYLSPSPINFEAFQQKAAKFRRRLHKTKTNADLMASVMIARISEKYSFIDLILHINKYLKYAINMPVTKSTPYCDKRN